MTILFLGLAGWIAALVQFPPILKNWLPEFEETTVVAQVNIVEATVTQSATRRTAPAWTPAPNSSLTPTNAADCEYRAEVLQVDTTPRNAALPLRTVVRADITLCNGSPCVWHANVRLALTAGDTLGAANSIVLWPLLAGTQIQIQLCLRTPKAPRAYSSVWETRLPDGRAISSRTAFFLTVGDLPILTPAPIAEATVKPNPIAPLSVLTPALRKWTENNSLRV